MTGWATGWTASASRLRSQSGRLRGSRSGQMTCWRRGRCSYDIWVTCWAASPTPSQHWTGAGLSSDRSTRGSPPSGAVPASASPSSFASRRPSCATD
eukprot:6679247-Alexandrium_andersonii.AAC.1